MSRLHSSGLGLALSQSGRRLLTPPVLRNSNLGRKETKENHDERSDQSLKSIHPAPIHMITTK
jgi:hypothetical protein